MHTDVHTSEADCRNFASAVLGTVHVGVRDALQGAALLQAIGFSSRCAAFACPLNISLC